MGWVTLAVTILQLIVKIWDAIHEHNIEKKKRKTEALQSVARGIIDRDRSRVTSGFDDLRNA